MSVGNDQYEQEFKCLIATLNNQNDVHGEAHIRMNQTIR